METNKKFVAQLKKQARNARLELKYEDVCSEEPPEPNTRFFTRALVNGQYFPIGGGKNAKEAKRNAAKNALEGLREKENPKPVHLTLTVRMCLFSTRQDPHDAPQVGAGLRWRGAAPLQDNGRGNTEERPAVPGKSTKEAKEEAAEHLTLIVRMCLFSTRQDPHDAPQCSSFVVGDKEPAVPGKSTKEAKEEAAEEQDPVVKPKTRFTSDFDCIEKIGEGSYAQVFKAKRKLTQKYHAIKIVRCGDIEKALQEVKILSDLDHHNIVRYFTCWLEDSGYSPDESGSSTQCSINPRIRYDYLYIQTELCVYTLRVWIYRNNEEKSLLDPKRRKEALTKFRQTVRGVEYIHSKMLIHRDLKPENIMIGQDGKVKIVDFGMVTRDNDPENLRERSMYKGTPSYMAPEQIRQKTYDRKVDIFPLGLIYFELLWKMTTYERAKVLTDLRELTFPKEFQHNFHQEYLKIKPMLNEKPEQRPEASQIHADLKNISDSLRVPSGYRHLKGLLL